MLETNEFKAFSDSALVLVSLDFPRRKKNRLPIYQQAHNDSLAAIYNPNGYFPFMVVIDANGKIIGQTGFVADWVVKTIAKLNQMMHD